MLLLLFTSSPVMYVCLSVGGCVHVSTTPCKQEVPDPLEKAVA